MNMKMVNTNPAFFNDMLPDVCFFLPLVVEVKTFPGHAVSSSSWTLVLKICKVFSAASLALTGFRFLHQHLGSPALCSGVSAC